MSTVPGSPTVPTLDIHLLGAFRLVSADTPQAPLSRVNAPRLQGLLAYLVLHRDAPQPRQQLAYLLWPDTSDAQARTNLRQLLHALRQALPAADQFVHVTAHTLQWRADAPCRLDVAEFEAAFTQAEAAEQQRNAVTLRGALEQASAVYQGDLLPSCYDDWVLPERERLRQAFSGVLERLLLLLEDQGEPRAALGYAHRLLRHDPLREETYRALMRLYAACGDRAGVRRAYQTCAAVLERELGVEPSAATQQAYSQALRLDAPARPVASPPPAKTNLPVQLTSFVGRERELAELKPLLLGTRLLTLTGPGGTGKTRLALRLAADVLEAYPAGVWLVELAPLADPALVPQAVAASLGVQEQPGRSLLDALVDYLRAKTLLLILDNCEHLIATCAQLAETVLRAAPGMTILASSREALGIAGETAHRVPPLSLPDLRQVHDLDALSQNDSVHLFVERAATAYPPFRLTMQNALAIAQICRRLDGIPLAIELAAARTKLFPPEQIAARLDDRFRLLTGGSRTALPRHQTLFALIEWSHELLSQAERALLRRLAVFAGGFSLEAAQAVCGDGALDGFTDVALDTLARLADKSLIEVDMVEGRFRLLETIRQYAREKLLAVGEAELIRDRHLDFFLQFAEKAEPKLRSAKQLTWLERLETEHDNLRTALAWALERGTSEHALRLAGALSYFWELRGYFSEGQRWLDDALSLTERQQSEQAAIGETPAGQALRAKALYRVGMFRFFNLSDPAAARRMVEESLRLWRELGDKWSLAVALAYVGLMLGMQGDVQTARAYLEEGVSLARELEEPWPLAVCLIRLGDGLKGTNATGARRALEEGVAIARRVGDKSLLSDGLREVGPLYFLEGDFTTAASVTEEALAEARAIGSTMYILLALLQLVFIACLQDNPAKAKGYCSELWAVGRESGSQMAATIALWGFGLADCFGGQPGRGVRLLAAFDAPLRQSGMTFNIEGDPTFMVYRQTLEKARAQLGPAAFEAAWTAGEQMTLEQAIALATEYANAVAPHPPAGRGPATE